MPAGILTIDALELVVDDYFAFDEFAVDVETTGPHRLDPHRNEVFWISLAGPGRADVIPCGHPLGERVPFPPDDELHRVNPSNKHHQERRLNEDTGRDKWFDVPETFTDPPSQLWISDVIECLRPLFFSKKRRKIGQQVKFDIESLAKYFGAVPPGPYADTIVAAKLIDENQQGYDLASLVRREFHYSYAKIGKKGVENFPYSEAYLYSYLDAKYTWLLWQTYRWQLKDECVDHIFDMEMDLLPVLIDMERTGTPIDEDALDELGQGFAEEMARIQVEVDSVAGFEVNLSANRQVAKFVYDVLDHECVEFTPTQERSVAKATLEAFVKDKNVATILDYAGLKKLQSGFVDGLKKRIYNGLVHPDFDQVGTVSGRLSCRNPNVQQIPSRSERGKQIRQVFIPSAGNVLIVSDLSQIELRMLAHFTQDKRLMQAYREGLDLHGVLAERVFGPNYTPIQRMFAKNAHFSILFGAGAGVMVRKYQIPNVRIARQLLKGFYDTYRSVEPWKDKVIFAARGKYRKGVTPPYVETILGRRRRLPALNWLDKYQRSAAERQAISVTISGSAADLFKVAMIQCYERLQQQEWKGHILMTVHDEIVVEVPEEFAEEAALLVKTSLENVMNPFTGKPMLSLPVIADTKIVKRWSDAK